MFIIRYLITIGNRTWLTWFSVSPFLL